MLKAVVFDDEYIVVKGLEEMIDWNANGIELIGSASDGQAALEMFNTLRPDIILTDIRMPRIDGLQLVEAVLREEPQTYCIVFSGFNEFEYVKRAIELGVKDYIEKPITIQSIEKSIEKAKLHIAKQQDTLELRTVLESARQQLIEKATIDLLLEGAVAEPKWRETVGRIAEESKYITVCCLSDDLNLPQQEDKNVIDVRSGKERVCVILHNTAPSEEYWEQLHQVSDQEDVVIGCGRTFATITEARQSYKEAQRALRYALFLQVYGIVRFEDTDGMITNLKELTQWEEAILLCLRAGSKERLMEQISLFISWIKEERLDIEIMEREMLKLIYLALEASKEANESSAGNSSAFYETFMPHIEIQEAAAMGKLTEWFYDQLERIAELFMESHANSKHVSIERACHYIEQNLSRSISLQEVADHVGMNPTYLSVLFKEAMGESYIKYLTRYRMETAKLLLQKGRKVTEVSEKVGYHTYRHFSEIFKKYTGVSPGLYKEQLGLKKTDINL